MKKFCILSIDGGGLRGVVPLTVLQQVEIISGKKIKDLFQLVAGTSTGGLLTSAINIKDPADNSKPLYNVDDILEVYKERGKEIFPQRDSVTDKLFSYTHDLLEPKYGTAGIEKVLNDLLKDHRINDCFNDIMVFSYDLNNNVPLIFKSRASKEDNAKNALLYDIARATSAGPTYLPSYKFSYPNNDELPERNCIDGGVYINNPTMGAFAEYLKYVNYYSPEIKNQDDIAYDEIFVLSLGTGSFASKIKDSDSSKGKLFWASHISDIMMKGVSRVTDYEMEEMLDKDTNYLRLNIDIDYEEYADMDNSSVDATNYLIKQTNEMLKDKQQLLTNFLQSL
ncbi:MAG: patatin-like phospholipase family protein [Chitinophagaceae bacterium]|jgi:patatin-like phospholipase/acyl hydrolase|nr:patatin-like phospholipase family protein [Chitinophagaceae bacterium]